MKLGLRGDWYTMFIARQPIFNKAMKIYGYELLFRSTEDSKVFSNASSSSATAVVIGGLFEQGIDKIVGNNKAFVNFDYDFIMSDLIELIDPSTLVIEILETVIIDEALINRIKSLRKKGYTIALDDFVEDYFNFPAIEVADIIKYDIMATPLDTIGLEVQDALNKKKILLAEKIETEEEYIKAKAMGFSLFQGFFFSRPNIVKNKMSAKKTSKAIYTNIIKELKKENFSYERITNIIESDVNLSYRLLYSISHKNEKNKYSSIKIALVRMGLLEIERWIRLLMLQDIAGDKPDEIFRLSLIRSKFGEYVAERSILADRKDEISMMCLFSMLDVLLDSTMQEALEGLDISMDIYEAFLFNTGKLKPICALLRAYESADWKMVDFYAEKIVNKPIDLTEGYLKAIKWASDIMDIYK